MASRNSTTTWRFQHADALLSDRHSGPRSDGAVGQLHVRHGRQRDRVQHRLDLRHLPVVHQARRRATSITCGWAAWRPYSASLCRSLAAYIVRQNNNIMDMLQLVFAFVNAPLFATFLLGMFWKRATGHGAFFGLVAGTAGRRDAPRPHAARRARWPASRAAGSARHIHVSQRDGSKLLDRDFRLDHLLCRDDRRQPHDEAAGGS